MVNVFGESVGSGSVDLQLVKKVVVTKGQYKDYVNEIQLTYELGFSRYLLHTTGYVTFVTPIVFIMGGYMYWTMLPRWILQVDMLQAMKVN